MARSNGDTTNPYPLRSLLNLPLFHAVTITADQHRYDSPFQFAQSGVAGCEFCVNSRVISDNNLVDIIGFKK